MSEIYIYLAQIYYLEGEYVQSLQNHMESHIFINDVQVWQTSIQSTCKTLKKLNKAEDIKLFL